MQEDSNCLFCKIVKKTIPSSIVFENDRFIAFPDIHPKTKTHLLVIPKTHIQRITDMHNVSDQQELLLGLWQAVLSVAHEAGIQDACKIQINNGVKAGQEIDHLHVHLLSDK